MNEIAWNELCRYLSSLQPGRVGDASRIETLLSACWKDLGGPHQEGTTAEKLWNRLEDVQWEPPELSFTIERHGATVLGSTRAALHRWTVDVRAKRAECNPQHGVRQLGSMAAPVRIKPIAQELAAAILARKDDNRLTWSENRRRVTVNLRRAIGATANDYKQTIEGRSRRLRDELIRVLPESGWARVGCRGAVFGVEDSR